MKFRIKKCLMVCAAIGIQMGLTASPLTLKTALADTFYYQLTGPNLDQNSLQIKDSWFTHHSLKLWHLYELDTLARHDHDPSFDLEGIYPGSEAKNATVTLKNTSAVPIALTMSAKTLSYREATGDKPLAPNHAPGVTPVIPAGSPLYYSPDGPNLADVLKLVITRDNRDEIYNGWMSNSSVPIDLGVLNPGEANYKFTVTMWEGAGNEYQYLATDLDLFFDGKQMTPGVPTQPPPTSQPPSPTEYIPPAAPPAGTETPSNLGPIIQPEYHTPLPNNSTPQPPLAQQKPGGDDLIDLTPQLPPPQGSLEIGKMPQTGEEPFGQSLVFGLAFMALGTVILKRYLV